jgi:uncharacterized repeat protein (TIGR01451 family)
MTSPASGNKPLYFHDTLDLSRIPPTGGNEVSIRGRDAQTWNLAPAACLPLDIDDRAGSIPVTLWIRGGNGRYATLTLGSSGGVIGTLGPFAVRAGGYPADPVRFDVPIDNPAALSGIDSIWLRVDNVSFRRNYRLSVMPYRDGRPSRIDLESLTVINVEHVRFYDAPHPGGAAITSTVADGPVYIRAVVSDPFGSFDISSAALTLITPSGVHVVDDAAMTEVAADAAGPMKTYEFTYPEPPAEWPAAAEYGLWTARVTAEEGTEGTVRHTHTGTLRVLSPPNIVMLKSVQVDSDPINGTTGSMSIPGAFMTYTVSVENHGDTGTDADSVVVTDAIPDHTALSIGGPGADPGPVSFSEHSTPSGLSFDPAGDVFFSIDGGSSFTLTTADLLDDGNGCDPRITHLRVNPKGIFNGDSATTAPGFTLRFRVRVR